MPTTGMQTVMSVPYAAGVLPIAFKNGRVHFLLGEDIRNLGLADFGGKAERRLDKGLVTNTAAREFFEETLGLSISSDQMVHRLLDPSRHIALPGRTQNGNPYVMFVTEVPFVPEITTSFRKFSAFLRFKGIHKSLVEKTGVEWLTIDELRDAPKRAVFERTYSEHEALLHRIGNMSPRDWHEFLRATASRR